ncbi:MAG: methyltransferase domain-containing protein [bacterium]
MNNFDIHTILSCPDCGGDLITNYQLPITNDDEKEETKELSESQLYCSNCRISFNIINSVHVLLPRSQEKKSLNYIGHYEKDAELFDYFEERECKASLHEEMRLRQYIVSKINPRCYNILDVGSGGAWLAREIDFSKHNLISLDLSEKNINRALKENPNEHHFGVVGDAMNPPFKKDSIDCIVASEIIEHIVNPQEFIRRMNDILKPGGSLIISTPYKEVLQYYLCIHCNQMTPKNAHLHSFDEKKLASFFNEEKHEGNVGGMKYHIFGNKALTVLRTHVFLKFLPFALWKTIDKLTNLILNKPAHIIIVYKKKK